MLIQLGAFQPLFGQVTWEVFDNNNSPIVENQINSLLVDSTRGLWVGTNWGLYLKNTSGWQEYTSYLNNPQVRSLSLDNEGNVWVGTLDGFSVFENNQWTSYNSNKEISIGQVNDITFDNNNVAYIATIDGLLSFDNEIELLLDSSALENSFINVKSLIFSGDSLVIGTINGGIAYYYNNEINWYTTSNSGLIDNSAYDLVVDDNNNLWIAAPYGGLLAHLQSQTWISYNTGGDNNWPSNSLTSLLLDNENFMFVGSNGNGFFRFYIDNNGIANTTIYNTESSPIPSNHVLCIAKDPNNYWIGTELGLVRWSTSVGLDNNNQQLSFQQSKAEIILSETTEVNIYSVSGKLLYKSNTSVVNINNFKRSLYLLKFGNSTKSYLKYLGN